METSAQYRETSAQYHEFAEECDRLATQAKTDGERKILEEMAEAWRRVAAEADNECVSFQPIVFRQSCFRVFLPNETTRVPCVAAKPAFADLWRCALTPGTLERSADTLPTLPRRNASPTITQRESAIGVPFFWRTSGRDVMAN